MYNTTNTMYVLMCGNKSVNVFILQIKKKKKEKHNNNNNKRIYVSF